ncbi:hypothetical protein CHLNCDRAFT_142340 [Chlorella variabilis]|uniref:Ysc84 actin-binding domain-containing protein n=1 Tax=Chlorella variabilis TaxID=554065 RepID=E1Z8B9_CHLVA|nr:hypothetical protein CHLNCDRAFT_142340 [Chlorella variabilis]EFN58068.1 hypothetical protein CHLNCDRAFT_142340 [Chlorella variabilis]|eukprot:XP_005850170.1 hypothetical protein CHLNCDRAFT_142340 [Chlorella variabilis]
MSDSSGQASAGGAAPPPATAIAAPLNPALAKAAAESAAAIALACTPQAVQQQQAARLAAVRLEHACGTTLAALCPREKLIPIPGHAIRAADGSGLLMVPAYQRITFIPGQTTVDENGVTKTTPNRRMYSVVEGDPVPLKPPTAEELAAFDRAVQKAKAERGQERAQLFAELAKDAEEHDGGSATKPASPDFMFRVRAPQQRPAPTSRSGRQLLEPRYSDPLDGGDSSSALEWEGEPILNLVTAVLGAGVLGFPFCFKTCGLGLAVVLVLVTLAAAELSMRLLLMSSQLTGKRSYEELARHTYGRAGQAAVDSCIIAMNVGSVVAYLNILTDTISSVAGTVIPPGAEPSRNMMLGVVTMAGCLPVALLVKSAQLLTAVSSLSMVFLLFFCALIALLPFSPTPNTGARGGGWRPLLWWRWEGVLVAFPIVSYGFTAHQYLFNIYPAAQRPSMRKMTAAVQRGMLLSAAIYVAVGACGYSAFGARCRAFDLLNKLTQTEGQPKGAQTIPRAELQRCTGLCFASVKKAGLLATLEGGEGFVIAKINSPDATTWSAPLFIKLFAGGLGLTMGYSQIDSLIVLDTQEAVQRYSRPHKFDLNMEAAAVGPFNNLAAHDDASVGALGDESFIYSVAKGTLVDISYKGLRYTLDESKNRALYGDASPADILAGTVQPPAAMQELQGALTSFMKTGRLQHIPDEH